MKTKIIASCVAAALSMLPLTGYSADSAKTYVKDSAITTKVKTELAAEKLSSLVKIGVDTTNSGVVVLTGTAASKAAVDRAVAIAKGVKGVTSVENNVTIKVDDAEARGVPPDQSESPPRPTTRAATAASANLNFPCGGRMASSPLIGML